MASADFLPNPGGLAAHVYGLSQGLARLGHSVQVVTHCADRPPTSLLGLTVREVPGRPGRVRGIPYLLHEARLLRSLVQREAVQVVHAHCLDPDSVATKFVRARARIITNHTSGFVIRARAGRAVRLFRWILCHADAVIAPSAEIKDLTVGIGMPEEKVFFIPNGVDVDVFRPDLPTDNIRQRWGVGPEHTVVFAARSLIPKNGVMYLIDAAEIVLRDFPSARFVIAGDGLQRQEIEARARRLRASQQILFLGNVSREDMPGCVAAADVAVLPSLVEATSIAGLEAMAAGKPLVGTRAGGIPEIVGEEVTGILVPPGNAEALAEGICRLIADPAARERMGKAARQRAVGEFSWQSIASKTVEVYERALAAHPR